MKMACVTRRVSSKSRVTKRVVYSLCCTNTVGQMGTEMPNTSR